MNLAYGLWQNVGKRPKGDFGFTEGREGNEGEGVFKS
jgi:hypothetical protein